MIPKLLAVITVGGVLALSACGNKEDALSNATPEALAERAATGDRKAAGELARRFEDRLAEDEARQAEGLASGDPQALFQDAYLANDDERLAELAAVGNIYALNAIGMRKLQSPDISARDEGLAMLEQSAEGGNAFSARLLGETYLNAMNGVEEDFDAAESWGLKAADLGDAEGYILAGSAAIRQEDEAKALDYFRKAKAAGSRSADLSIDMLDGEASAAETQ